MNAERIIREIPGQRRVARTLVAGEECVTRTLLSVTLSPALGPLVERIVLDGHGSMLGIIPEELQLTLEGYRVAARLPRDLGPPLPWTHAVAAGVNRDGHITISTSWIEGTPLHHLPPATPEDAETRALDALRILVALHARLVSYGDFKPENLVLRPDGSVALIDLDTLREVAEATAWAPTRDLTRAWAAPEQERAQRTYLPSDLWSWARLVEHLFPAGPPPAWRPALEACRLADPLLRPRTDGLLTFLEIGGPLLDWRGQPTPPATVVAVDWESAGIGDTSTERVPETPNTGPAAVGGATERVPETPGDPHTDPGLTDPGTTELGTTGLTDFGRTGTTSLGRTAVLERKRRSGCLWWALGVVAAPILLCAGLTLAWDRAHVEEANVAAEEALSALKANKTRPELNRDRDQRNILRQMADDAYAVRATPRSSAVRALATVWAQGWQDAGRSWSAEGYAEGLAVLDTVVRSDEPEALLARATLEGGACRLDSLSTAAAIHCSRALDALARFHVALPRAAEHHWMRVEAAWTEVLVRTTRVAQLPSPTHPEATADLDAARAICTRAEVWLPYAPVNGPELFQDCLRVAASAEAVDDYLRWGGLLVAADLTHGAVSTTTMKHIYGAAGAGCGAVSVDKRRNEWNVRGPAWCVAVGHEVRGCAELAVAAAVGGRVEDPARPWQAFDAASAARARATCVR